MNARNEEREVRNQVVLVGNVVADAEVANTRRGTSIVNFRIAVNDSYKDKQTGELVKKTVFIGVTAYDAAPETIDLLTKGRRVRIEGKLGFDQWESNDGSKKSRNFVHAFKIDDAPRKELAPSSSPRQSPPPSFKGSFQKQAAPAPQKQAPKTGWQKIGNKYIYKDAASF